MSETNYRYIYGPVSSWRLGRSLGVDPISAKEKICTFDCVYCQLGKTKAFSDKRLDFVAVDEVVREIRTIPAGSIDYITFSGAGEPTLAKNLGAMIAAVRKTRKEKIAVITNSSLMYRKDVKDDLLSADLVLAKLDAASEKTFQQMNGPMPGMTFEVVLNSLKEFRAFHKGRLALQIMFTAFNEKHAGKIAEIAKEIRPDEIEINTPLRPCGVAPLPETALLEIENCFRVVCGKDISILNVYSAERKKVSSISGPDTLRRRGKTS